MGEGCCIDIDCRPPVDPGLFPLRGLPRVLAVPLAGVKLCVAVGCGEDVCPGRKELTRKK